MIIYSPTFTGSVQITGSQTVTGDLTVQGNLTAQTFILSSSVSYFTESFASGSTRFGDSMDDTMKVTGSLLVTGSGTFAGALSGTSATFSGAVTLNSGASDAQFLASTTGLYSYFSVQKSNAVSTLGRWNTMFRGDTYFGNAANALIFLGERYNASSVVDGYYMPLALQPNGNVIMCAGSNVLGNGNVLIGTTTDNGSKLQVTGAATFSSGIATLGYTASTSYAALFNGNVGIGTSSPSNKLDVRNGGDFDVKFRSEAAGGTVGLLLETANTFSGTSQAYIKVIGSAGGGQSQLIFGTAGASGDSSATEKMRITSGGQVNINGFATTTTIKLAVLQTENNHAAQFYVNTGSLNACVYSRVNDTLNVFNYFEKSGTIVGSISTNGTTTSYNISSDYRLKEDFKELNVLDKISEIKVYDFKWKGTEDRMCGVIAHELQEIIPYAVHGEKDGEQMQGVDYSKLVPILLKAIQELKAEIDILKAK